MEKIDGIILVNKPLGWTSFDVVAKIRGVLGKEQSSMHEKHGACTKIYSKDGASSAVKRTEKYVERATQQPDAAKNFEKSGVANFGGEQAFRCKCRVKVGHTGTLDPLASGLMILVVGSYCKRAQEFSKLDKTYEVQMKLGVSSTTGDEEGEKLVDSSLGLVDRAKFEEVLKGFLGKSLQTPPAFSAIKIDGQRAYKLAREGKEVKIEPREIEITNIKINKYSFPLVDFTVDVSSGTYIRSLVEDIGKKLCTRAYMSNLRRTKVGEFYLENAQLVSQISSKSIVKIL